MRLQKTRKNLNEKIAQLNAAIDDVSAQLRNEDGFGMSNETRRNEDAFGLSNENNLELESAA